MRSKPISRDDPGAKSNDNRDDKPKGVLRHLPLIGIAVVAGVGALTLQDVLSFDTLRDNREALLAYRDQHFGAMILGFLALYIAIVALSLPGAAVASVTGGFLFGLGAGVALNVVAATLGAMAIFLAARWGLGAMLAAKMKTGQGRIRHVQQALQETEIEVLLLLRLVPAVPFFVANLLPALVGVGAWNFFWTTAVGIVPGALVFTWIGVGLGDVFDRGETPDLTLLWAPHVIGPILGLCALAALPILIKALRGKSKV
ncbi:TVP38/TMEM64 family protein [Tritonibacter horizontis]|uniref:TVP38/TMEM64 family membrane protein n=1 Tax=Tritonibacter horizontis TaxID=1768241 RepID=A0A132BVA9_9RHOB|nr:VTT domain-containing protein [Tritonibacter horizontis]KUP92136.1 SNARE associated golgi protein [Tritonibacter horizontis]